MRGAAPAVTRPALLVLAALLAMPPTTSALTPFGVARDGPRWWLVDPDGARFFSTGVNCVRARDGGVHPRRRGYDVTRRPGFTPDRWAASTRARLEGWGFNTVGGWSDDAAYRSGMPFAVVLAMSDGENLLRVFDPDFPAIVRARAESEVRRWRDSRQLVGWFTDNELPWHGPGAEPGVRSLLHRFGALPAGTPGKRALVRFLSHRYGARIDTLRAAWDLSVTSFEALADVGEWVVATPAAQADVAAWAGVVAAQYGRLSAAVLHELDPAHLNLGVRFAGDPPDPVVQALGPSIDVVSVNYYRRAGHVSSRRLTRLHALAGGKPLLVSEFSWRSGENRSGTGNTRGTNVTVPTQADRSRRAGALPQRAAAPAVRGRLSLLHALRPAAVGPPR